MTLDEAISLTCPVVTRCLNFQSKENAEQYANWLRDLVTLAPEQETQPHRAEAVCGDFSDMFSNVIPFQKPENQS